MRQKANGQALTLKRLSEAEARAIEMVLDGLPSEHSRRAYERALFDFFHWHRGAGRPQINKAVVQRYTAELREAGMSSSSVNQRLSAIRKLVGEAADNGLLDPQIAGPEEALRKFLTSLRAVVQPNDVTASDIAEGADIPDLDKNGSVRRATHCHPRLEEDVGARLRREFLLVRWILRTAVRLTQTNLIVGGHQYYYGLRPGEGRFQHLAYVRACLAGVRDGL